MKPPTMDTLEKLCRDAMAAGDWPAAEAYGAQLDALQEKLRKPPVPLMSAALWYAEQGLAVFPLQPGDKRPMPRSRGCLEATCDLDRIRTWWERTPNANIGLATGGLVDVIDIDGLEGVLSWNELEASLPPLIGRVSTPRAGGHHLYIAAQGHGNRAGLAPSVDYRGKGGYVVAPPSRTEQGIYEWILPLTVPTAASAAA